MSISVEQRSAINECLNKITLAVKEFEEYVMANLDKDVYGVKEALTLVQSIKNRINDIENTL